MTTAHDPIHPGEILLEEFLTPMGITRYRLARTMSVPARRINEIVHGKRAISPHTARRMSHALGTSDRLWITVQSRYDLEFAVSKHYAEFDQTVPVVSMKSGSGFGGPIYSPRPVGLPSIRFLENAAMSPWSPS